MFSTSTDNPIRLDEVPTDLPGRLTLTIMPGKKGTVGYTTGIRHHRDIDLDIAEMKRQGVDLVVSLLDYGEHAHYGVPDLYERYALAGVEFLHVATPNLKPVPMKSALTAIAKVLEALSSGKTVVFHCLGGLGRAGSLAAYTLVTLGSLPRMAIDKVREYRPGAIETQGQERAIEVFADLYQGMGLDAETLRTW